MSAYPLKAEDPVARYGATLLRCILGVIYVMHGYLAWAVTTPEGITAFFEKLDWPLPGLLAWYLIAAHGLGGLMLILGLWTRLAALANIPIMAAAVLLVHLPQGFFMKGIIVNAASGKAQVGGYEFALLLLVATAAQLLLGGGALALTDGK